MSGEPAVPRPNHCCLEHPMVSLHPFMGVIGRVIGAGRRPPRGLVAAVSGILVVAAVPPAAAADWPQFGQTPMHDNSNSSERAFTPGNAGTLVVKWNADIGSNNAT